MLTAANKKARFALPARASIWYVITSALERGITFIFTPIFTRALTTDEFGLYPLYVSWMGVFTVFITLELSGNIIYRGLSRFKGREDELISTSLLIMSTSAAIMCAAVLIFGDAMTRVIGLSRQIILLLIAQIYTSGVVNLFFAKCRYFYKYKLPSFINIAFAVASPALSLFLINFTRVRSEARIVAPLAVTAIIALPIAASMLYSAKHRFSPDIARHLLKNALPLLPHYAATTVMAQIGKITVGRFYGEGELAKYSVVFSMGFLFSLVTGGINSALSPWITRKLAASKGDQIEATAQKVFPLLATMTLMGLCFSPEGLAFLAPAEYRSALGAVYPISISVLFTFLVLLINAILLYFEKGHLVTVASLIAAAISIILNLTVTSRYGYIAAALIQAASSFILLVISVIMLGGVLKKRSFSNSKYLRVIIVTALFAWLLFALRDVFLSRVFLFISFLLVLIPQALECKNLIKEK
ncbi:MAG: oligosaccharide flippase family protein [Clostridia bacterium]|nr:oligosaccharide flippase family protein [Clostridia bacterium]